jgi:formamidopyrimidine-DNA glycosylase
MPELPEVETFARLLRDPLIGKTISDVKCAWPRHIDRPDLYELHRRLVDRVISTVERRGKYLVFGLDDDQSLIVHLKMTGHLSVVPSTDPADDHVHTVFSLSDGNELRFRDTRKFGRIYLVEDAQEILSKLGPEPLSDSLTERGFQAMLQNRKRILKPLLLDQAFIAGIGNIYADEALHGAGILPTRISNSLSEDECRALFHSIQEILTKAIDNEGASIDDYRKPDGSSGEMQNILRVYGRADKVCYRCGDIVERMVLGGRGTHFCRGCQN